MSITNQAAPSSAADLTGRRCTCGAAAETAATIASAPPPPSPKLTIGGLTLWSCLWAIFLAASLSESLTTCEAAETILLPGRSGREGKHRDRLVGNQTGPRCSLPDPSLYLLPVVGILTHPGDGASGRLSNATGVSFIAASYVKFVEAAGARVIPLIYNEHRDVLNEKLSLVNGVLFTGGWAKTGLYFETAQYLLQKILERNDAGDHCPLFVICLGFEIVCMAVSKDNDILEPFTARSQVSTLEFVEDVELEGTVFRRFPPDLLEKLSKDCLVLQNHRWGISPKRLQGNAALSSFFKILTTSFDENGLEYVSTVQGQRYPVTGFQWHPEKNAFEWGSSIIPHSEDAVQVTQLAANFLVSEARKSSIRPASKNVLANLIYNYSPTYSGKAGKGYDEVYIFT